MVCLHNVILYVHKATLRGPLALMYSIIICVCLDCPKDVLGTLAKLHATVHIHTYSGEGKRSPRYINTYHHIYRGAVYMLVGG